MADVEFLPRRAEPGMTFTYVGTTQHKLDEGEDLPEGAIPLAADPGDPDTRYYQLAGVSIDVKADDEGVVHPKNPAEVALLDTFDLPVARKAAAEKKADTKPAAPEAPKEG